VLTCPHCGGARLLIARITQRSVIERILDHLGLPSVPPQLASARGPPEFALAE
jgi:hypothetical protein